MKIVQGHNFIFVRSKPIIGWLDRIKLFKRVKGRSLNVGSGNYKLKRNSYFECSVNLDIIPRQFPNFIQGDITKLHKIFDNHEFDVVWCAHVLEHLPIEILKTAISNLFYVAKYVVIIVPDGDFLLSNIYSDHLLSFTSDGIKKNHYAGLFFPTIF